MFFHFSSDISDRIFGKYEWDGSLCEALILMECDLGLQGWKLHRLTQGTGWLSSLLYRYMFSGSRGCSYFMTANKCSTACLTPGSKPLTTSSCICHWPTTGWRWSTTRSSPSAAIQTKHQRWGKGLTWLHPCLSTPDNLFALDLACLRKWWTEMSFMLSWRYFVATVNFQSWCCTALRLAIPKMNSSVLIP